MKVNDIVNDDYTFNWELLEKIPEFNALKGCKQSEKWHPEGDAYEHTKLVCEAFTRNAPYRQVLENLKIIGAACAFHDIGKPLCTEFKKDDWHSYGHEIYGEKIVRDLFYDEDFYVRERLCSLVRYHMVPKFIMKNEHFMEEIIKLSNEVTWYELLFLNQCDKEGSKRCHSEDDDTCLYNNIDGLKCFNSKIKICKPSKHNNGLHVYMLIGLPGAGKSTWVKKFTDGKYKAISRDDIRFELGFCDKDQKVVLDREKEDLVTKEFNKQIKERLENNNNIIIDNINLKKKYREEIKNYIKSLGYDPYYEYIYIEAPSLNDNIKRRENQISEEVFHNMIRNFDFPRIGEYDVLRIKRNE